MIDPNSMVMWWGKLESQGSDIPVIFDPSLPGMPNGQVYLYNAVRNAIVPYDWGVVQRFLKDVEPAELKEIKKTLRKKWHAVRKEYVDISSRPSMLADGK